MVLTVLPTVNNETWEPDLGWMDAGMASLAQHLTPDTLASYQTSLSVGTTRPWLKSMIQDISGSREDVDFDLVFSPEQLLKGPVSAHLRKFPELEGVLSECDAKVGTKSCNQCLTLDERRDQPPNTWMWNMGSPAATEMANLAEATYRGVNIGLVNQFAVCADREDVDGKQVIDACKSQPCSHIRRPGIPVGDHRIPVCPSLSLSTDPDAPIVSTARQFEATMPDHVVNQMKKMVHSSKGQTVTDLGASYRGTGKVTALSAVFEALKALHGEGAAVAVEDPMCIDEELSGFGWNAYHAGEGANVVIVQADRPQSTDPTVQGFPSGSQIGVVHEPKALPRQGTLINVRVHDATSTVPTTVRREAVLWLRAPSTQASIETFLSRPVGSSTRLVKGYNDAYLGRRVDRVMRDNPALLERHKRITHGQPEEVGPVTTRTNRSQAGSFPGSCRKNRNQSLTINRRLAYCPRGQENVLSAPAPAPGIACRCLEPQSTAAPRGQY